MAPCPPLPDANELALALGQPEMVLDYYQGITDALISVEGQYYLAAMIAWDEAKTMLRAYAISPVGDQVASVFLRNMRSDYCDLARKSQEIEALVTASDASMGVLVTDLNDVSTAYLQTVTEKLSKRSWRDGLMPWARWQPNQSGPAR